MNFFQTSFVLLCVCFTIPGFVYIFCVQALEKLDVEALIAFRLNAVYFNMQHYSKVNVEHF